MILGAAVGGAAGLAAGYRYHKPLWDFSQTVQGKSNYEARFDRESRRIIEAQRRQTVEDVRRLKAKYETPIYGKVRVWDLVEKLGQCIDPTDTSLYLTSQFTHVQQILAGMERDGVKERDQILIALLHDLGKVMLLAPEAPEHVVGFIEPVTEAPRGEGLNKVIYQFGHDEIMYQRLKDHVPERIAWAIRYHSVLPQHIEPFLDEKERVMEKELLVKFRIYDQGSKSYRNAPHVNMKPYRELIEELFPNPILI